MRAALIHPIDDPPESNLISRISYQLNTEITPMQELYKLYASDVYSWPRQLVRNRVGWNYESIADLLVFKDEYLDKFLAKILEEARIFGKHALFADGERVMKIVGCSPASRPDEETGEIEDWKLELESV